MTSDDQTGDADGGRGRRGMPLAALGVLVLVAVLGFSAAYFLTGGDDDAAPAADELAGTADDGAGEDAAADDDEGDGPDYDITVEADPDPPVVEGTDFTVTVTHDGEPVTDAEVRINLEMTQHAHEGVSGDGDEVDAGVYEVPIDFIMRGLWEGRVRVDAPDEPRVTKSIDYDVQ